MRMVPLLALAPHRSTTAGLLAEAARERGMEVVILSRDGIPDRLRGSGSTHYYGGPHFASDAAGPLGLALLEPDEGWLDALPYAFTGRRIKRVTLSQARREKSPVFVKPPTDKSFPAAVYEDGSALQVLTPRSDPVVQVSEVVTWAQEFRLFLLDGEIRTGSQYATFGRLDAAPLEGHPDEGRIRDFAGRLTEACGATLPSGVVVDIGRMRGPGGRDAERWAVVEANMAWFSTGYAADPAGALDVVLRAAGPRGQVLGRDARFCRP
ncbi:ATP-grasp domain-containing protein [Streptomyces sp. NPDC056452]|uniref:ATP-grasp domain-containing protein n=1 Tax=Streptomyces sp. NPDC056452 TaxID=3345821 RepID=UPI00367ED2CA